MTNPSVLEREVATSAIDGLLLITVRQVGDERGTIREFARASVGAVDFPAVGAWQQINVTETRPGALRGLHGESMTKLVGIVHGEAFGAYVDTRAGSATRGRVVTTTLVPGRQVLVPAGVCNGFQSLGSVNSLYVYCFDDEWRPGMAGVAVNPLDPELGIAWPVPVDTSDRAQISAKDVAQPTLREVLAG